MKLRKTDKSQKYQSYLVILLGVEYFSAYHLQFATPAFAIIAVVFAYYLLIEYNNFAPIVMLILSARVINGFIIPSIPAFYTVFMVLTYYLPIFIFIARNVKIRNGKIRFSRETVKKYRAVLLYTAYFTILFLFNFMTAKSLFLESILPILLVSLCIIFVPREAFSDCLEPILSYLRMIFIVSLVLYALPHYSTITSALVKSGRPFGVSVEATGTLIYLGVFRNNGIFFDCRILGIFTYVFIYLIGFRKNSLSVFDVVLSGITVATTLSRGGIVGYLTVLLGYLILCENTKTKFLLMGIGGISLVGAILLYIPSMSEVASNFLSTFNLNRTYNVLSQRSIMSDYAINVFKQHPIVGGGIGSLTTTDANRVVFTSSYVTYNTVTDAYIYSLLGEIGIIGTLFFGIQFYQLITVYSQKYFLSLMLFLGMGIHMIGTDIPKMRLVYFCILMLISIANWYGISKQDCTENNMSMGRLLHTK